MGSCQAEGSGLSCECFSLAWGIGSVRSGAGIGVIYLSIKKKSDRVSQREGSVAEERASCYPKLHKLLKASFEMSRGTSKGEEGLPPEQGENESQTEEGTEHWGA